MEGREMRSDGGRVRWRVRRRDGGGEDGMERKERREKNRRGGR